MCAAVSTLRGDVLGTQVLLGFEFRSFFESRFDEMPEWAKVTRLVTVCVMLLAFALLVFPASFQALLGFQLAVTLMGYARSNPDRINGRPTPVIVYDPDSGREAFSIAMKKLKE